MPPKTKAQKTIQNKTDTKKAVKTLAKPVVKTKAPTADVYDISGKKQGTLSLPKEIFGQKPNQKLITQAIHVYFAKSTAHRGSTKTRSEVRGGGTKPWRQKGTGRARAGSIRSPLWVGGGKTFGPKARTSQLTLPKKMKRAALVSVLSQKAQNRQIMVISNLEKCQPKTKIIINFLKKIDSKGPSLFIVSTKNDNVKLATRNIGNLQVNSAKNLNAYEIIKNQMIFLSREALTALPTNQKSS